MPARIFGYFDDWRNAILECPSCGWKGTFGQGLRDQSDMVMDSSCPNCAESPMLAVVSATCSVAEYQAHRDSLKEAEKAFGDAQVEAIEARARAHFLTAEDLPELEGDALDLVWDADGGSVVLLHQGREIGRELGGFENYRRFLDMVRILEARYGRRFRALVPTDASMLDLLGDEITALGRIRAEQARLRDAWERWNASRA